VRRTGRACDGDARWMGGKDDAKSVFVTTSIERAVDRVGDARGIDWERMMDREDNDEIFREGGDGRTDGGRRTEGCVRERARERED